MNTFIINYKNYNRENIKLDYTCDNIENISVLENIIVKDTEPEKTFNYSPDIETNTMFNDLFISYLINKYEPITNTVKTKLLFKNNFDIYGDLYNVLIESGNLYVNNNIQLSLVSSNITNDKRFTYYEIFKNIKFLSKSNERTTTNCSFQIFGPDEIIDDKLFIISDFYEMAELFRRNLYDYNDNDSNNTNNIIFYKPLSFGKELKYNKIELFGSDYLNLQIKHFNNNMETLQDYENIIDKITDKVDLFDIRELHYMRNDHCLYESKNLFHYVIYVYTLLSTMAKGGSVILSIKKMFTYPIVELLYFMSLFFKKVIFFRDKKDIKNYRLVFIFFRGCDKLIIKKYKEIMMNIIKHDPKLGNNINNKNQENKNCIYLPYQSNNISVFIHHILNFRNINGYNGVSKTFIEFIQNINTTLDQDMKEYKSLHMQLRLLLRDNQININKRKELINDILKINLSTSIKWCIDNKISFNEDVIKQLESMQYKWKRIDLLKYFFPPGIDYNKLQLSYDSYYSISMYKDAEYTTELIKRHLDKDLKDLTITDGCANVGGNTLNFLKHFKFVNAVEYDSNTAKMLKNNIDVYNFTNYKVYSDDYTKVMSQLKQDVVFLDPPWGGVLYKYYDTLNLYLGKLSIAEIINKLLDSVMLICLKVPHNYDVMALYNNRKIKEIHIYILKKYKIIIIK